MKNKDKIIIKRFISGVLKPILVISLLLIIGIVGFMLTEQWSLLDAFYMSVISLTTVGYEIPDKLSVGGKFFTCIYLLFSVVIFLYLVGEFARHIISINVMDIISKRKMDNRIKNLRNHYIIRGYGRTGRAVAQQLKKENLAFVVIEKDLNVIKEIELEDFLAVEGNATEEAILRDAGIQHCSGLFAALSDDSETLFLTITAIDMRPSLRIAVRCSKAGNEEKFKKVGVDEVISPFQISGIRMVSSLVRPLVADFLDEVINTNIGLQLRLEQFYLPSNSVLCDKTILDSDIRPNSGAYIMAIQREHKFIHNPTADMILKSGDYLLVLGTTDQLLKLENIIKQKGSKVT